MNKYKKVILTCLCLGLALVTGAFVKADKKIAQVEPIEEVSKTATEKAELGTTIVELETLFVLMQERMSIMHDLARYKWNQGISEKTLDQEKLTSKTSNKEVVDFLEAQNKAAEKIVKDDFALFRNEEVVAFEVVKDYNSTILPQLENVNQKMVETVQELLTHTQNESLPNFLKDISFNSFKNEGIDRSVYDIAVEPLFEKE